MRIATRPEGLWLEHILERGEDDAVCLQFQRRLTYRELRSGVQAWAAHLRDQGIRPGSTVALRVPPSFTSIQVLLALWTRGTQVLLLDHRLKPLEVTGILRLGQPEFLIRAQQPGGILVPFKEERDLLVEATGDGLPARTDHCLIQFSSGSTGRPKAIGRTSDSLLAELDRWEALEETIRSSDRLLLLSSPTHSLGLVGGILHTLLVGATLVFSPTPRASDILETLVRTEASAVMGAPFHYELLTTASSTLRPERLRLAISGGERPAPLLHQRFKDRYGIGMGEAYGLTETGLVAADLPGRLSPSVGRVAPGIQLELREGEIFIYLGYSPYLYEQEPGGFHAGWLRTHDRGTLEPTRRALMLWGRSDSLVIIGGLKVDLGEIEAALRTHERVDEVVVLEGEGIEAYIGTRAELSAGELLRWCMERLAHYKLPKRIFIAPSLPRTTTGKLLRNREALHQAMGGTACV